MTDFDHNPDDTAVRALVARIVDIIHREPIPVALAALGMTTVIALHELRRGGQDFTPWFFRRMRAAMIPQESTLQ
jgi:hypothetical protein